MVTAELSTEQASLTTLQRNVEKLQCKIRRTEDQRKDNRTKQENEQANLKNIIQSKQRRIIQ